MVIQQSINQLNEMCDNTNHLNLPPFKNNTLSSPIPNDGHIFTITPPTINHHGFTHDDVGNNRSINSTEIIIGIHNNSCSTCKLDKNTNNYIKSQDSSESLIPELHNIEKWYNILGEVCIPFIIAGLGMVGAGILLNVVKEWNVFKNVPEFLVLVTPLLGLKGNLEMTLASRLSTHANLGHMDTRHKQWHICFGNLALTQVQAIVVGFLASTVAIVMGLAFEGRFTLKNATLLCATSVLTAAIASCILGILMVVVILLSKKYNLNPDNIATPIAASLGDVITLGLLAWLADILYDTIDSIPWLTTSIIISYLLVTPIWIWISYKNDFTRKVLITGWPPVVTAMLISSGGGMILDIAESKFPRIALYQPVINGVGGNLVSVQASRISTSLHRDCKPGQLPNNYSQIFLSPWNVFIKQGVHSVAACVLLGIVIPGHLIFSTVTYFISIENSEFSLVFTIVYLIAAVIQVGFLLYIAHIMINWFWIHKIDPDTSTIPYLTSMGDLIGTGLLFLTFEIVYGHIGGSSTSTH